MARDIKAGILSPDDSSEPFEAGCPMLIHAAAQHPMIANKPFMRCALGWSVYTELAQARCAATHAVEDCWQEHPEKTPNIEQERTFLPFATGLGKVAAD